MGTLRLILALSVVLNHSGSFFSFLMIDGLVAVQIFFIISGFYMTMVLNGKYNTPNGKLLFLTNRFLRLFPLYITVVCLTLLSNVLWGQFFNQWGVLEFYKEYSSLFNNGSFLYIIFTNLLLFTQDIVMFLQLEPSSGSLVFTENFRNSYPALFEFLFIPQGWSLGIELSFYLLAPYILKRKLFTVLIIISITLIIRFYISQSLGWNNDPWPFRFFPTTLTFFLFGTLSFHFYNSIKVHKPKNYFQTIIILSYFIFIIMYQSIPKVIYIDINLTDCFLYLYSIVAVAYLFNISKSVPLDNYLGELSYPIYLIHALIITILTYMHIGAMKSLITILLSFIVSAFLLHFIETPIKKFRLKLARKI